MVERNAGLPPERRIEFRIGIHLGDVVEESDGDLMGDGVNIAARLEGIADRGGICISRQVLDQIEGKLDLSYRELGRQNLKNIVKPVEVYTILFDTAASPGSQFLATANLRQKRFAIARRLTVCCLAYATVGNGPPMLRSAHWLGHLEYHWELPIFQRFLLELAKGHTLVRYDARGNGLSDWDVRRAFIRCLGERYGDGRRRSRARSLSVAWFVARVSCVGCLRGPASGAGLPFDPLRRLCARVEVVARLWKECVAAG